VFFALDSSALDAGGQAVAAANAEIMRNFPTWVITIEGHCDERGTVEYTLALGERRAKAAADYLASLGVPADRFKTVSYGKEVPLCQESNESCWSRNRRAHFAVTGKTTGR
jgi:peptidoglycan-associated lipoprotein